MIKRIVLIFLAAVLICSGLFFFINRNNTKKLVFWSIQLKPIYEKQINKIITDFEKEHKGVKVVWVDVPIQEAQKRTLASILSSTPADLVNLNPEFSQILAQKNALEFFEEYELDDFNEGLVDKLKYKGEIYAVPFYATSPVTIYNKEIYDKCINSKFPKTYDELFSLSPKLYSCSHIAPYAASLNENDTLLKILNKYDIDSFDSDKEKKETIRLYNVLNNMYKKGYMPKDTLNVNHREVIEKYMSQGALTIVAGSNFIKMIKQNAPDIYAKSQIAPQLTGKNSKYDVSLMNLIIPKKAKNKELAREFAFTLTNEENQLELAKLTNVLPANKYALEDDYFKNCTSDLEDKSRCMSVRQLNNLVNPKAQITDKKLFSENINKTLEEILLDKNSCPKTIEARINNLFPHLNILIEKN